MPVDEVKKPDTVHEKTVKEAQKVKGLSDEPHPLDRRSGTGRGYLQFF
jgi:hypothetical protein